MNKLSPVEWLVKMLELDSIEKLDFYALTCIERAKEKELEKMEFYKNKHLKYQLFIGKVTEILGDQKTIELLRESFQTIDQANNGNNNL
jgi:Ca2+-binding EF-hand superfamily protein